MLIHVKVIGFTPEKAPCAPKGRVYSMKVDAGYRILDVIAAFGLEEDPLLSFMLNGNNAERDAFIKDGDEILFMHAIYGG